MLPGGTANVLANELGLGSRPEAAAEKLLSWTPRPIALGRITTEPAGSRYFLMMCGAGLDADVVYDVHAGFKAAAASSPTGRPGSGGSGGALDQLDVRVDEQV